MKLQASACNFIKKRLWHRCFSVNFAKFLRTTFLQNTTGRLLLSFHLMNWVSVSMNIFLSNMKKNCITKTKNKQLMFSLIVFYQRNQENCVDAGREAITREIRIGGKQLLNKTQEVKQRRIQDRSSHWKCSVEKVFLKILQNSQENTCARVSFLTDLQALDSGTSVFLCTLRSF